MNGAKIFAAATSGLITIRVAFSGNCNAIDFGINSPITTCIKVIKINAMIVATECDANVLETFGNKSNKGCISLARVASPTQPSPILAIVIMVIFIVRMVNN